MTAPGVHRAVLDFADARGVPVDRDWALRAREALTADGVEDTAAASALAEACAAVARAGESPEQLFGAPEAWAAQVRLDAVDEGRLLREIGRIRGRDVLPGALGHAAVLALLLAVGGVAAQEWVLPLDRRLFLLPGLVAGATWCCAWVWDAAARRRSRAAAHARAWPTAALLFGGIAAAWATVDLGAPVLHRAWLLLAVPGYGLAWLLTAWAAHRDAAEPAFTADLPDEAWAAELGGVLRADLGLPDARVRDIVCEARAHAATADASLAEEFGAPAAYAARFQRQSVARTDALPLLSTSAAVLFALIVAELAARPVAGPARSGPVLGAVVFTAAAVGGWWRYARGRGAGWSTASAPPADATGEPPHLSRAQVAGTAGTASPWALPALALAAAAACALVTAASAAAEGHDELTLTALLLAAPVLVAAALVAGLLARAGLARVTGGWGAALGGVLTAGFVAGLPLWALDRAGRAPLGSVPVWAVLLVGLALTAAAVRTHLALRGRARAWHAAAGAGPDRADVVGRLRAPVLQSLLCAAFVGVAVLPAAAEGRAGAPQTWVVGGLAVVIAALGWADWARARR